MLGSVNASGASWRELDEPNKTCVGNLVSGMIPGTTERYMAQIDIPARRYNSV